MSKKLSDYEWSGDPFDAAKNMKQLLDTTGPGFCLAKFRQASLHLGIGKVHACYHPFAHNIDKTALAENPNVLFNTTVLKTARKEMLSGQRPAECSYCWRIEDADNANLSDRPWKSAEHWTRLDHDDIVKLTGDEDIFPSYIELSFSNACNLACIYCSPEFSSKWAEELKYKGAITLLKGTDNESGHNIHGDVNGSIVKHRQPYVDAFWKWFPVASKHIKVLRLTGGEPLLHKETFDTIDWLIENPNTSLQFCINSNFSVADKVWDKFIDRITLLHQSGNVERVSLYTSVEAWGNRAEYIRKELDFNVLLKRITQCLSLGIPVVIMAALNILALSSYQQLLAWVLEQKRIYNSADTSSMLLNIDTNCVNDPTFLDAICGSTDLFDRFNTAVGFAQANIVPNSHHGIELYEYDQLLKIQRRFATAVPTVYDVDRAKLVDYIDQLDSRYGVKFLDVFPEYTTFYNQCDAARTAMYSQIDKKDAQ